MRKNPMLLFGLALALLLSAGAVLWASAAAGAPVAENLELETYRGVSVGGRLAAADAEGGSLRYEITTPPGKGAVDLSEDGRFVYTPEEGRRGRDYFGYRATDAEGNQSQEATVIIRILKPKSRVTYTDTTGSPAAYAAQRLAEEGVYEGERLGGRAVFRPEDPISREEFLALCMLAGGHAPLRTLGGSGFADDALLSDWARGYVDAALNEGVISGYAGEDGSYAEFRPQQNVTAAEAAVMLDRSFDLTDAVLTWYDFTDTVPVWARQSAVNVSACALLPEGVSFRDESFSRGDAAIMLVRAMDLAQRRANRG